VRASEREHFAKCAYPYEIAIVPLDKPGRCWTQVHSWDSYRYLSGSTATTDF